MIIKENVNVKGAIEQWLKIEYTDGLTNEFNNQPSLINFMKKDKLVGEKKEKHWALGVSDNVVALGATNDTYVLGQDDFGTGAVDTVKGEFGVTKIMGMFAISDEVIVRGTTSGSIFNVLKDSLNRMQIGLNHKMKRFPYGGRSGKIGVATMKDATSVWNATLGAHVITVDITNSKSVLPGMGIMFHVKSADGTVTFWIQGKIWQKDNSVIHKDTCSVIVEKCSTNISADPTASTQLKVGWTLTGAGTAGATVDTVYTVYSRQLQYNGGTVAPEYIGLEDIVMTKDNTLYGVDRSVYKSLNCTVVDLADDPYDTADEPSGTAQANDGKGLLTEGLLRDLSDHLHDTMNDTANLTLVASKARIVSTLEKQFYQFKRVDFDSNSKENKLGRPGVQFDEWKFHKDKFSRDNNVYLLDPDKIGELQLRDWKWITNGVEGILERRQGSEMFEGIMNKYADIYIEEWRVHAAFKNAAEDFVV